MRIVFKSSFARDLKKIRSKSLRQQIQHTIEQIEQTSITQDIPNLKKLTGDGPYYRIRMGDYRFGLIIDQETITFCSLPATARHLSLLSIGVLYIQRYERRCRDAAA